MTSPTAIELLEDLISDLEAKLNLAPGADPSVLNKDSRQPTADTNSKKDKKKQPKPSNKKEAPSDVEDIPEICKLEFKVGLITKVWVHPEADKLYCEEIDVGEEGGPRQIASGLRMHYSEEEMLGKRVLVVSNLKVRFDCIYFMSSQFIGSGEQILTIYYEKNIFMLENLRQSTIFSPRTLSDSNLTEWYSALPKQKRMARRKLSS
jgi:tRNA-binding EMAP/Myf-like protein